MTTTPATAEQKRVECRRLAQEFGKAVVCCANKSTADNIDAMLLAGKRLDACIDALAAMAKAAEGANSSAQQSGEAAAWRWIPSAVWGEYVIVGDKAHAERAAALGMKVEPLYPQQAALTEGDVSAGYSRADCDYDCYMAFECGVRFAEEKHGIGGAR